MTLLERALNEIPNLNSKEKFLSCHIILPFNFCFISLQLFQNGSSGFFLNLFHTFLFDFRFHQCCMDFLNCRFHGIGNFCNETI